MKKFLTSLLFAGLVFFFAVGLTLHVQAAGMEKTISGTVSKLAYSQSGGTEEIRIYTTHTTILRQFVLEPNSDCKNYRIGIEIADAVIQQNGAFDINQGSVYQIRYANKQNPQAASIVIETTKKPDYTVKPSGDGKYLVVTLKGGVSGQPSQTAVSSKTSATPSTSSSTSSSATPAPASNNQGSAALSYGVASIGPISVSMQGDTGIVRFEGINLNAAFGSTGKIPSLELREKEKILQVTLPGQDSRFKEGFIPGNSVIYGVLVSYNNELNSTIVRIVFDDAVTYSHEVSGGSSILKIKKASSGSTGGSGGANTPNTVPSPAPTATPAPSTGNDTSRSDSGKNTAGTANIQAGDGIDVALKLVGTNIVGKYRQYADKIIAENDMNNNAYAVMFPAALIDLGQGSINIDNALVSTVTTLTTPNSSFLKVDKKDATKEFSIVEGSSANELLIVAKSVSETPSKVPASNPAGNVSRGSTDNTSIRNPGSSARSKLVVLDAGHGGSDPGAEFDGYLEKTFNLDITLRVEAILKQKGINVMMTRNSDVFVGLEERAEMANSWGADLFISIHNNSMPEGIKGSMAFYYPTSYKGKSYAKIILDNMYDKLNMGAMGSNDLRSANYVVLRQTKMPAVLVEVACMSHPDDLNLLKNETFRQKAAEVLADSIIQILNQM